MQLIIGLGNPGEQYLGTRHNVGFMVVDKLQSLGLTKNIILRKSSTFMNDSGSSVKEILDKTKVSTNNLYIVHDDLDLPLGTWKIQFAKGPKDNGGINSIEQILATKDFWRVRVGIDNRNPETRTPGEEYVLQEFTPEERKILDGVISTICKKLATW